MTAMEFFQSLHYDNGLEVVKAIWEHFPMQYSAALGLDGSPMIRPIEY